MTLCRSYAVGKNLDLSFEIILFNWDADEYAEQGYDERLVFLWLSETFSGLNNQNNST